VENEVAMPIFLDRHNLTGLSAADIAEAHRKDLEVQARYGVRFLTYWFDQERGTGFCLIDAPDAETAMQVHDEAHGDVARVAGSPDRSGGWLSLSTRSRKRQPIHSK
jgi:hypothetical protein